MELLKNFKFLKVEGEYPIPQEHIDTVREREIPRHFQYVMIRFVYL